jgi:hypothetical protein
MLQGGKLFARLNGDGGNPMRPNSGLTDGRANYCISSNCTGSCPEAEQECDQAPDHDLNLIGWRTAFSRGGPRGLL